MSNPIFGKEVARMLRRKTARLGFLDDRPSLHGQPYVHPSERGPKEPRRSPYRTETGTRFFEMPTTGLATREPATRNAGTSRSWLVYNGVKVFQESEVERNTAIRLTARRDIKVIYAQYPILPWSDKDGVDHKHTCDFYVEYLDGWRQALVVKMEEKRKLTEDMIECICARDISHVVDEVRLVTEIYANHATAANARWILWSRKRADDDATQILLGIVERLQGCFRFGDLLRGCNDIKTRHAAIWRLIDHGILIAPTGERITELTWLTRVLAR